MQNLRKQIDDAYNNFNYYTDKDLYDAAIYDVIATNSRIDAHIKQRRDEDDGEGLPELRTRQPVLPNAIRGMFKMLTRYGG